MEVCVASECQERLQNRDTLLKGITVHTCITNREKNLKGNNHKQQSTNSNYLAKGISLNLVAFHHDVQNVQAICHIMSYMSHSSMSKMSKLCRFVDSISLLPAFYLLLFATRQRLNGPEPVKERSANGNLNKDSTCTPPEILWNISIKGAPGKCPLYETEHQWSSECSWIFANPIETCWHL